MIRKVTISNFKGIRDITLDVPSTLVLFGKNNSGKSTILQALAIWSEVITAWLSGTEGGGSREMDLARDAADEYRLVNLVKTDFRALSLYGLDHLWFSRVVQEPSCIVVEHTDWSIGLELKFHQNELISVRPTDATSEDDLETYARSPLRYTYVAAKTDLPSFESYLDRSGIPLALQRGNASQLLRNLVYQVSQQDANWKRLTSVMLRYCGCELMEPSPSDTISVFYRQDDRSTQYELGSAGDGLLQMLSLYAATLFTSPALILIDEPGAHLHPSRQQVVLPDLCEAFPDSQVICATHSPYVLTTVRPEQIMGVSRDDGEIRLEGVPQNIASYGAEVGDVLALIMHVGERPKGNKFATILAQYSELIAQDQGETKQATRLRKELNSLSPRDLALDRADIEINRRRILKQMRDSQ